MTVTTDQSNTPLDATTYSFRRGSLNDFLKSEKCQQRVDNEQARLLSGNLQRHDVLIWKREELWEFEKTHPEYFEMLTEDEIARGVESLRTIWEKYHSWCWNWDRKLLTPRWRYND